MAKVKLLINGKDYSDYAEGIDAFEYAINLTEDGAIERGSSNQLKVTGKLYELIYDRFFANPCEGRKELLKATFQVDCQGTKINIPMELPAVGIDICLNECEANIVFRSTKVENEKYNCLKSQTNYHTQGGKSNGFADWIINQARNYKMVYCQDYTSITYILLTSYTSIKLIVDSLQALCKVLSAVWNFFGGDWDCGKYFDQLENAVIGCNHYHDVILVKDIFEYNLQRCGLEFESSILKNDPTYKNVALEAAIDGEGFFIQNCKDSDTQFNEANAENLNLLQLATKLQPVFNAEFRIKNGKFIFERKDYFYKNLPTLFNLDTEYNLGNLDDCPNFQFNDQKLCAYWRLDYLNDFMDAMGNKMLTEYNEIVEWNEGNYNEDNKGECRNDVTFSPARFSNDLYIAKIFGAVLLTNLRGDDNLGIFETGSCDFTHAQIITDGQLTAPKLIVIDPTKPVINCYECNFVGAIKKRLWPNNVVFKGSAYPIHDGVWDYNYPMKGQQLYDNFHFIDDPKGKEARYIDLEDVVWTPRNFCEAVNLIFENELSLNIESNKFGGSHPKNITINFKECKIKLGGLSYKCQA